MYNYFLDNTKKIYEEKKGYSNCFNNQKILTQLKKQEDYIWLNEVNSQSLQITLKNLDNSFNRFFKKISGFPKFHKKSNTQNFGLTNQSFKIGGNRIILPKFRKGIKFDNHREIEGKIVCSTVSQIPSGEYYITITTEREIFQLPQITKKYWY